MWRICPTFLEVIFHFSWKTTSQDPPGCSTVTQCDQLACPICNLCWGSDVSSPCYKDPKVLHRAGLILTSVMEQECRQTRQPLKLRSCPKNLLRSWFLKLDNHFKNVRFISCCCLQGNQFEIKFKNLINAEGWFRRCFHNIMYSIKIKYCPFQWSLNVFLTIETLRQPKPSFISKYFIHFCLYSMCLCLF